MQVHFSGMDPKFLSNSQKSIFDSKGLSASLFLVGFSALSLWWIDLFYFFFFFFLAWAWEEWGCRTQVVELSPVSP